MDKLDIVNQAQFLQHHCAGQSVKVAARYQSHFLSHVHFLLGISFLIGQMNQGDAPAADFIHGSDSSDSER
jgi:hypothetical protein